MYFGEDEKSERVGTIATIAIPRTTLIATIETRVVVSGCEDPYLGIPACSETAVIVHLNDVSQVSSERWDW